MSSGWMDDILDQDRQFGDDSGGSFYCPFTNGAECALLTRGWQPQELCNDLECEQMKLVQRRPRARKKAA